MMASEHLDVSYIKQWVDASKLLQNKVFVRVCDIPVNNIK